MPVPSTMADLVVSAVAGSPPGGEIVGTNVDDYVRAISAIVRRESARGADIAIAGGILTPGNNDGSYFVVTSTSGTITGISNSWVGREVVLVFSGPVSIVHSSNLILPGGADIQTASGKVYRFKQETATPVWRCVGTDALTGPIGPPGPSGSSQVTFRIFLATGTWVRPAGCKKVWVRIKGGGGAGGSTTGNAAGGGHAGGGGGGGEYAETIIDVTALPSAQVIIGAGGLGSFGSAGGNGGQTAFNSSPQFIVNGGIGGGFFPSVSTSTAISSVGGIGGSGSTATGATPGDQGGHGMVYGTQSQVVSGKGGDGLNGGGALSVVLGGLGAALGADAVTPGSGGSGAANVGSTTGQGRGGHGKSGICILMEFY